MAAERAAAGTSEPRPPRRRDIDPRLLARGFVEGDADALAEIAERGPRGSLAYLREARRCGAWAELRSIAERLFATNGSTKLLDELARAASREGEAEALRLIGRVTAAAEYSAEAELVGKLAELYISHGPRALARLRQPKYWALGAADRWDALHDHVVSLLEVIREQQYEDGQPLVVKRLEPGLLCRVGPRAGDAIASMVRRARLTALLTQAMEAPPVGGSQGGRDTP